VEWQFQRTEAERDVRNIKGVIGVTNLISVAPKVMPSELKNKIEDALVRSVKTDAQNITVEVQDRKVILKGTVKSMAERREAERAAWRAPGVSMVDNQLVISYN